MLNGKEIRELRDRYSVSLRDVAKFCDLSAQFIGSVGREDKAMNESNNKIIINGIHKAYFEKVRLERESKEKHSVGTSIEGKEDKSEINNEVDGDNDGK